MTRLSYNSVEIEVNSLHADGKQIIPVCKSVNFDYYSVDVFCQFCICF